MHVSWIPSPSTVIPTVLTRRGRIDAWLVVSIRRKIRLPMDTSRHILSNHTTSSMPSMREMQHSCHNERLTSTSQAIDFRICTQQKDTRFLSRS